MIIAPTMTHPHLGERRQQMRVLVIGTLSDELDLHTTEGQSHMTWADEHCS